VHLVTCGSVAIMRIITGDETGLIKVRRRGQGGGEPCAVSFVGCDRG